MLLRSNVVASLVLLLSSVLVSAVSACDSCSQHQIEDSHGAVASESKVCSQIGINLLKDGGNAADALVGTVFCVGVIGMYHSGYVH